MLISDGTGIGSDDLGNDEQDFCEEKISEKPRKNVQGSYEK